MGPLFRPQPFNELYKVPTLVEVIRLAQHWSERTGRTIGVYPETKHPTYHQSVGLPLEEPLVEILDRFGLNRRNSPVFIHSFEVANLKKLNHMTRARLCSSSTPTMSRQLVAEESCHSAWGPFQTGE